jgi:hypothetical protein
VLIKWLELDSLEFLANTSAQEAYSLLNEVIIFITDKWRRVEDLVEIVKSIDQQSIEALFITAWALSQVSKSAAAHTKTRNNKVMF